MVTTILILALVVLALSASKAPAPAGSAAGGLTWSSKTKAASKAGKAFGRAANLAVIPAYRPAEDAASEEQYEMPELQVLEGATFVEFLSGIQVPVEVRDPDRLSDMGGGMDIVINLGSNPTPPISDAYSRLTDGLRYFRGIVRLRPTAYIESVLPLLTEFHTKMDKDGVGVKYFNFHIRNCRASDGRTFAKGNDLVDVCYPPEFTHIPPHPVPYCVEEDVNRKFHTIYHEARAGGRSKLVTVGSARSSLHFPDTRFLLDFLILPLQFRFWGAPWDYRIVSIRTQDGEHGYNYDAIWRDSLHAYYILSYAYLYIEYIVRSRHMLANWGVKMVGMAIAIIGQWAQSGGDFSMFLNKLQRAFGPAIDTLEKAYNFIKTKMGVYVSAMKGLEGNYALQMGNAGVANAKARYDGAISYMERAMEISDVQQFLISQGCTANPSEKEGFLAACVEKIVVYRRRV